MGSAVEWLVVMVAEAQEDLVAALALLDMEATAEWVVLEDKKCKKK